MTAEIAAALLVLGYNLQDPSPRTCNSGNYESDLSLMQCVISCREFVESWKHLRSMVIFSLICKCTTIKF
uniref:Uncharacterized protein n=1 Tax=Physcomitrium patens TaxID=3218 RepID=A0A2K1JJE0_PHYPA|nr:hypothetical protein PHYPA_019044 [Physcomitrium patens]